MLTYAFILLFLTSNTFVTGEVYSTCYEYETYCLFSFGPNVTVSNVSEAQKICEDAKNGSWLLEIVDGRVLKNVVEFLYKHSFPKDTKWILKAEKTTFLTSNNIISSNDIHFHQPEKQAEQNKNRSEQFSIICLTGCSSEFEKYDQERIIGAISYNKVTPDECKEKCETSTCEAYERDNNPEPNYPNCWIHTSIKEKEMSGNINGMLYVINRSVKTTDICIGNITEPASENSHWNEYRGTNNDSMEVLYIILVILLIAIIFIAVIIFWKRRKNRKKYQKSNRPAVAPTYPAPFQEGSSSTTSPSSQSIETEQQHKQIESIVYADLLLFQKADKSAKKSIIVGPMGDVYAQVNRK